MLEFTKYLIYASFILNIACGVCQLKFKVMRRMGAHRHRPVDCGNEQEKLTGTVGRGCVPPAGGPSSP